MVFVNVQTPTTPRKTMSMYIHTHTHRDIYIYIHTHTFAAQISLTYAKNCLFEFFLNKDQVTWRFPKMGAPKNGVENITRIDHSGRVPPSLGYLQWNLINLPQAAAQSGYAPQDATNLARCSGFVWKMRLPQTLYPLIN